MGSCDGRSLIYKLMQMSRKKRYTLLVLLLILTFNYIDRVTLGVVLQNIKVDLGLTDSQLGLLSGIAFALFYSVMGIPIARWADRGNRVMIIGLATASWCVLVALFGAASSFWQLVLIRVGIGVGEAGCVPPAHSLISEIFERTERPRAFAIYTLGQPLSFLVGYLGAGWLNELYGWRITFAVVASPGFLLAALAFMTLQDPRGISAMGRARRCKVDAHCEDQSGPTPAAGKALMNLARDLASNKTFRQLLVCLSILYFVGFGILQWQPTFFVRSYGLSSGTIGTCFALSYGGGGILGSYLGGVWSTRYAVRQEARQLRASAVAVAGFGLLSIATYLARSAPVAFVLMGLGSLVLNAVNGPFFSTIQTLMPQDRRATAIAIAYFFANLVGMGLGPWAVGALSDALKPFFLGESLRYSLLVLAPIGYFWGGAHMWWASRYVTADLKKIERVIVSPV